jgi:hypothetical protein
MGELEQKDQIDREYWVILSTDIAKGLETERKKWFEDSINILAKAFGSEAIKCEQLTGEVELIIKAFQLYMVSFFMAKHQYISSQEGQDFADIL